MFVQISQLIYLQHVQRQSAAATRASNELPKTGGDYEVYNTNKVFSELLSTERKRLTDL